MENVYNKDRALNALQKIYGNQSKYGEYTFELMDSITNITFSTGCIHLISPIVLIMVFIMRSK